ncbi:MAG: CoA pyrophosphatase, partial [Gammaproteobacteria bacterium]|nr:CoA pyrophosphatase [Gammaproteobacteria bacterium]
RRFDGREVELTDLPFESRTIWGATAGMLLTLYRLLRGEVMA